MCASPGPSKPTPCYATALVQDPACLICDRPPCAHVGLWDSLPHFQPQNARTCFAFLVFGCPTFPTAHAPPREVRKDVHDCVPR